MSRTQLPGFLPPPNPGSTSPPTLIHLHWLSYKLLLLTYKSLHSLPPPPHPPPTHTFLKPAPKQIGDDFCGLVLNQPLGGLRVIEGNPLYEDRTEGMGAVAAYTYGEHTVVFVGTRSGQLKKLRRRVKPRRFARRSVSPVLSGGFEDFSESELQTASLLCLDKTTSKQMIGLRDDREELQD
eukprot:superscaffoldBa00008398_g23313